MAYGWITTSIAVQRNARQARIHPAIAEILVLFVGLSQKPLIAAADPEAAFAYTRSASTIAKLSEALESGMVSINHIGLGLPEIPHGGIKDSGYGSEGGAEALESFFNNKLVTVLNA